MNKAYMYSLYSSKEYTTQNLVGTVFYNTFRNRIRFNNKKYLVDVPSMRLLQGDGYEEYYCYEDK